MKKRIVLSILLTSLVVLGGGALNRESLQNDEGTLAIYVEDEKVENIPSKGNSENYVFDHAVCMDSAEATSVLYLDENVKFVSGSGTREDPYILDL